MPKAVAEDIYRKHYWNSISGDDLPPGIDLCTLDGAVNSGVGRSDDWLSYGLNIPPGKSYATLASIASQNTDHPSVVKRMCSKRLSFLHSLKTWSTFGRGWGARVAACQARALSMALQASGKTVQQTKTILAGEVAAKKKTQSKAVLAPAITTGGSVEAAQHASFPIWAWDVPHIALAVVAVGIIAFVIHKFTSAQTEIDAYNKEISSLEQIQSNNGAVPTEGTVL